MNENNTTGALEIGDVVYLKSGSPAMVVSKIDEDRDITAIFFDAGNTRNIYGAEAIFTKDLAAQPGSSEHMIGRIKDVANNLLRRVDDLERQIDSKASRDPRNRGLSA